MGVISTEKNMITLYYHSESSLSKQTLAYIESSVKKILTIDISKTKVTGTQWTELASKMDLKISDLIEKKHPNFTANYNSNTDLGAEDWLKILDKHPEVLMYPIAIIGEKYIQLKTPSGFVKYMESNSKGIEGN